MGYNRNLSGGEIIEQVLYFARLLKTQKERVTNIVFMGMGEPFYNYENLKAAINRMNHPQGMNLGKRRFTVSTVGVIPGIKKLAKELSQVNLAISLHAADDQLRSSLIPINKKYPIENLLSTIREYISITRRRVTLEWVLILGLNDTEEQALKLAALVKNMLVHVNVIPLNPTEGYSGQAATKQTAQTFHSILTQHGISCTIRLRRGIDIKAGCGQLAAGVDE
jgi:23S rRNA (adenine2503-C2)-methyltransferase